MSRYISVALCRITKSTGKMLLLDSSCLFLSQIYSFEFIPIFENLQHQTPTSRGKGGTDLAKDVSYHISEATYS